MGFIEVNHEREFETITRGLSAVKFDYETFVYLRKKAYPMVDGTWDDEGMTAKNPSINSKNGKVFLNDGDYIVEGNDGFYVLGKEIVETK